MRQCPGRMQTIGWPPPPTGVSATIAAKSSGLASPRTWFLRLSASATEAPTGQSKALVPHGGPSTSPAHTRWSSLFAPLVAQKWTMVVTAAQHQKSLTNDFSWRNAAIVLPAACVWAPVSNASALSLDLARTMTITSELRPGDAGHGAVDTALPPGYDQCRDELGADWKGQGVVGG